MMSFLVVIMSFLVVMMPKQVAKTTGLATVTLVVYSVIKLIILLKLLNLYVYSYIVNQKYVRKLTSYPLALVRIRS